MKVIHILRKPCSEPTVAVNVLRHGVGGIHIAATRISFISEADEAESKTKNQHADFGSAPVIGNVTYGDYSMVPPKNYNPPGRWPANLVLQHLDCCSQEGVRKVKSAGWRDSDTHKGTEGVSDNFGATGITGRHYGSEDGTETIPAWICVDGCPVADLDAQSGMGQSAKGVRLYKRAETSSWKERGGSFTPGREWEAEGYGDTGGASRFFKQVKSR